MLLGDYDCSKEIVIQDTLEELLGDYDCSKEIVI